MKQMLCVLVGMFLLLASKAQKVDSIYFNLYTDSLKKGTYNYINVDGKMDNGRWLPMTSKEITFTATAGRFDNNSLFVDKDFKEEKITVTAALKSNTAIQKSITIYIKQKESEERLKTPEEITREIEQKNKTRK